MVNEVMRDNVKVQCGYKAMNDVLKMIIIIVKRWYNLNRKIDKERGLRS